MEEHSEQRKFQRVGAHIPVKYRRLGESEQAFGTGTISKNISAGGVRFRSPDFISRASRLIVELDIPMFAKPVKAISKVAWICKTESGESYEVGNKFLEISKKDKELVSEYVKGLTQYNITENQSDNQE